MAGLIAGNTEARPSVSFSHELLTVHVAHASHLTALLQGIKRNGKAKGSSLSNCQVSWCISVQHEESQVTDPRQEVDGAAAVVPPSRSCRPSETRRCRVAVTMQKCQFTMSYTKLTMRLRLPCQPDFVCATDEVTHMFE